MKISYCVTACNEEAELQKLLDTLLRFKRPIDEVIVLIDDTNSTPNIWAIVKDMRIDKVFSQPLNRDFATFKNFFFRVASGDYIFQLDADEFTPAEFIESLPILLEENLDIDLFLTPRINIVRGITPEHIAKWRWSYDPITERINFPDYQTRIYRNAPGIRWQGTVHEKITGFKTYSFLPKDDDTWCIYHEKDITKQESQNQFYDSY